ncbi:MULTISPECIES: hypothetical protein [Pseudomonas]|jgi:hypothetical protein|uniref:Uncharacterized protein n=2 Tax=Pseudomonas TaxID=286 RepID=A0A1L7NJU2_PSEPU|nr:MULTISPECIES: hypothetical protein [Pseudomonas]ERT18962.1 hypothetical protein O162_08455 [Pseudomonas putida SJ3]PNB59016.1 hypothetical protein C1X73_12075 [Pseudomonas sp. FW305-130]AGN83379.1 hypothetical protein L483_28660 [Pseudomonas putida H8234]EKT4451307.1 hypothetical protein [Pseudomonas putida]MBP2080935.1 hypothetical protein [Pseudomonas sp. PvP089]
MKKVAAVLAVGLGLGATALPAQALSWASVLTFISTMQTEMSAWSVTVKQTALSANVVSQMDSDSKKQLANAVGAIDMSDRVMKAATSFDSAVGQPVTIKCTAQEQGKLFVEAVSQRDKDAARLMATYASQRVGSRAGADQATLAMHRDTYCTVSEARQGMCALNANGMQGWDVDYAGPFSEKTLAPEGEAAAYAYTAMITDQRAEAHIDCTSVACNDAQSQQLAASAMSAMAANSLVGQVTDRRVPMLTGQ